MFIHGFGFLTEGCGILLAMKYFLAARHVDSYLSLWK